ncbi:MAG: preQ(1) synthase [Candidatus Natronoplasma sp.]
MELKTLENKYDDVDYKIKIISPEFTCLCPGKPDQPDFATISITYVPDAYLIELKSLKYYLVGYRDKEIYHETATNKIKDDLVEKLEPRYIRVRGDWNIRGGITTIVETEYKKEDWDKDPRDIYIRSTEHTSTSR